LDLDKSAKFAKLFKGKGHIQLYILLYSVSPDTKFKVWHILFNKDCFNRIKRVNCAIWNIDPKLNINDDKTRACYTAYTSI